MNNTAEDRDYQAGKMLILPSTFLGSSRYMMQNYHNTMSVVRVIGKSDLFITMTCNPQWRAIRENLFPGQQASDRPGLCTRVFHLKKERLIKMITKEKYFRTFKAHVHVIEFQKRGLPDAHILITSANGYKFTTPEIVDKFISAEIPDPDEDPELYNVVVNNMIHRPCEDRCIVNVNVPNIILRILEKKLQECRWILILSTPK
jgi:hypothetical protein